MGSVKTLILICDDKGRMRETYSRAVSRIADVGVMTIDHPMYVLDLLRANRKIGVVLMDLEFPVKPGSKHKDVIGHKYLSQIRDEFPKVKIVVVTQLGPDVYKVVLECETKRLHDAWIDVGKVVKEEEIAARIEPLIYPLRNVSKNGLWMLHLSDLHFGRTIPFKYWGLAEDGQLVNMLKQDILENIPKEFSEVTKRPDLLLITGDITDKARDDQLEKAEHFIRELSHTCLSPGSLMGEDFLTRVLIVPGNHEANFDISRARGIVGSGDTSHLKTLTKDEDVPEELRYLKKYIWAPFERFCNRLQLVPSAFAEFWNKDSFFSAGIWRFPEFGTIIYGINTSAQSFDHFSKWPKVDPVIISKLEAWSIDPSNGSESIFPKILMAHHSLGSTTSGIDRVNDQEVGVLRKALWRQLKTKIILTGHVHEEIAERIDVDGKMLLSVCAGSAAIADEGRPEREPLHYNLINMRPKSELDESPEIVTIYSRISFREEFVGNPKTPRFQFVWDEKSGWVTT